MNHQDFFSFIKRQFPKQDFIGLHEPYFDFHETRYVNECVESTFVSSIGEFVIKAERKIEGLLGTDYAIAVVNGTSGLQLAIKLVGVEANDEVLTQALSFVATSNAIRYNFADPVYIDVDQETLGMSPMALKRFLHKNTRKKNGHLINKLSGKKIKACIPMHTFGMPCKIDEIIEICDSYEIPVIEDAAESLGSTYKGKHLGTFGKIGVLSFNGNKIVTSGGGGAILTSDKIIASKAKHLSNTAKLNHPYEYVHDELGYNFRMPNINASLLMAQLDKLNNFLKSKRKLANTYREYLKENESMRFIEEIEGAKSNYWLNAIQVPDEKFKYDLLNEANKHKIMLRPIWKLSFEMPMYKNCLKDEQENALKLSSTIVNLPSSYRPND